MILVHRMRGFHKFATKSCVYGGVEQIFFNVGAGSQAQGPDKENVTLVTQLKLIHSGRKKNRRKNVQKNDFV